VLTINLLYADEATREARLGEIADFSAGQSARGDPVDVILLQEVVGGPYVGATNSSADLEQLLEQRGLWYNRATRFANGQDDPNALLKEGNAILSRCGIALTLALELPQVEENPFPGISVSVGRNVMMSRIIIPGTGAIDIFNTHLCSFCAESDRSAQLQALLNFAQRVQGFFHWDQDRLILGGDFNIDLNSAGEATIYDQITRFGLQDAYSAPNSCAVCCSEAEGYGGCSYAVPGNPYGEAPARLDYIFVGGLSAVAAEVVFNHPPGWVSDHSGVLAKLAIPRHIPLTRPGP
jgi:maltose 6'-phosphate phosphatase